MPSLKRRSDFLNIKQQGQFLHVNTWLGVSFIKSQQHTLRWGWTLSKKIGNAVTRNRLKRWGKEFVRRQEGSGVDVNLIFKNKGKEFYKQLSHEEFDQGLGRGFKLIEKSCCKNS